MHSFRIRAATLDDAAAIVAFNLALADESERRRLDPRVLDAGVRTVLGDPARGRYFVAGTTHTLIGQMMLTQEWSDWRNGAFWWIQSVYVRPDWRGRGVFTALFEHVESLSRRTPTVCGLRLYVEQDNARAQAVYRHCGLSPTPYRIMELDRSAIAPVFTETGE